MTKKMQPRVFSLYTYTYHLFGGVISHIESYSISCIIIDI